MLLFILAVSRGVYRGKNILELMECVRFLHGFEISRALLPPASHGEKRGNLQNLVEIVQNTYFFPLALIKKFAINLHSSEYRVEEKYANSATVHYKKLTF